MELTTEEPVPAEEVSRSPRLLHRPLVYQAPEFSKRLDPLQEIKVGDNVVLECQFKAFPQPTIKWFKDDQEITGSDERFRMDVNDSDGQLHLSVTSVTKTDEGAYKCKVENQEGVASTTGYLSVTGDSANRPKSPSATASANGNGSNGNGNGGNKSPDARSVSLPPLLRTIIEQKSLEEREEKQHEPEPFQPMLEGRHTWPLLQMGYGPGWTDERKDDLDAHSSGSDTSVGSQELEDFGSFVLDEHDDLLRGAEREATNKIDLHLDDLDLDLDDDVFRKEPNQTIISSVPLNIFHDDISKDRAESSTSSDLFIVEADDLLSNYSSLSRDLDSGVLSGSGPISIESAIEVAEAAPVASSPPLPPLQTQQSQAATTPLPQPTTQPQPMITVQPQPTTPVPQSATSPQSQATIPVQPQPTIPIQPPTSLEPQTSATIEISVPKPPTDRVDQPPSTKEQDINKPNIPNATPISIPSIPITASVSSRSISTDITKADDTVSIQTPTPAEDEIRLKTTSTKAVSISRPAAESLYTRETLTLLTSDLAAILIVLISTGTFLGTSLGISPVYYVLLLSVASLICFQIFSAQ